MADWAASASGTLSIIKAITDDKMNTAIVEGHNSLGWLAWHLVDMAGAFGQFAGLNTPAIERGAQVPERMGEIVEKYEAVIDANNSEVNKFMDEMMTEEIFVFGGKMIRGKFLRMLIDHQAHHRCQMTVLHRSAYAASFVLHRYFCFVKKSMQNIKMSSLFVLRKNDIYS